MSELKDVLTVRFEESKPIVDEYRAAYGELWDFVKKLEGKPELKAECEAILDKFAVMGIKLKSLSTSLYHDAFNA